MRLEAKGCAALKTLFPVPPILDEAVPPVLDGLSSLPSFPPRVDTCHDDRPHFKL